ncbi:MAG: YkgJ family cysteine cluster protein [Tepidiformaceae bacterium]
MLSPPPPFERMQSTWESLSARYEAYQLALPGSPQFICQPQVCNAHCCRAFSVNLGDGEVERMQRSSGLQPIQFLESENGELITLPLAQPFLLKRAGNHCAQLRDDLGCGQYEGRPNACHLYPHFVIFVDPGTARPVHLELPAMQEAVASAISGEGDSHIALLLRHTECPGFTGPAMSLGEWRTLFTQTFALQFPPA